MIINTNIQAMSAARNFGINTKNKAKSAEKLSSGYSINRAADDAADLTISEKMRAQIRALNKGTQNAQSGVSWVHVGEAALGSIQDMIHRMSEITIQSLMIPTPTWTVRLFRLNLTICSRKSIKYRIRRCLTQRKFLQIMSLSFISSRVI